MLHNTQERVQEKKLCRVIYNTKNYEFKTSKFEELVNFIKVNQLPAYIPSLVEYPNVAYLDVLIIFDNRNEYNKYKEQLKEFEE